MRSVRKGVYGRMLGCLLFAAAVLWGCKKEPVGTVLPYKLALMEGSHNWVGKKYFVGRDSVSGRTFNDSTSVNFTNSIHVVNDTIITISSTYLTSYSNATLFDPQVDTANKTVSFTGMTYSTSPTSYISLRDSLVYNYAANSIYWYEWLIDGIDTSRAILHTP